MSYDTPVAIKEILHCRKDSPTIRLKKISTQGTQKPFLNRSLSGGRRPHLRARGIQFISPSKPKKLSKEIQISEENHSSGAQSKEPSINVESLSDEEFNSTAVLVQSIPMARPDCNPVPLKIRFWSRQEQVTCSRTVPVQLLRKSRSTGSEPAVLQDHACVEYGSELLSQYASRCGCALCRAKLISCCVKSHDIQTCFCERCLSGINHFFCVT